MIRIREIADGSGAGSVWAACSTTIINSPPEPRSLGRAPKTGAMCEQTASKLKSRRRLLAAISGTITPPPLSEDNARSWPAHSPVEAVTYDFPDQTINDKMAKRPEPHL